MSTFLRISLRNLLRENMCHFINRNGNTATYPTQSIDSHTEFLFFITHPECGQICEDIFSEMRTILNRKGTSYLMVNIPKYQGVESHYNNYYKENRVAWPWVKTGSIMWIKYQMQSAGEDPFKSSPSMIFIRSTSDRTEIVESRRPMHGAEARSFLEKYNTGQPKLLPPVGQDYRLAVGF